jgi:hypothetical protein
MKFHITHVTLFRKVFHIIHPQIYYRVGVAQSVHRLGYGLDGRDLIPGGAEIFIFATTSRPALGSTKPPTQRVPEALPRE